MNFDEYLSANPWLGWGLGLSFGFPLCVVLLSEILHRLETHHRSLAGPVRHLRNISLPLLALLVFLQQLLALPPDDTAIKVVVSLVFVSVLFATLSFTNVLLFAEASVGSWRANVPKLFLDLSRAFFVFVGLGMVSGLVWDADLKAFFTALGIGSVVIGLALQDTLGNLFSGIALLFERPFSIGDVIRVGNQEGVVKEMTWRATWIHVTSTHAMLVIPNLALTKDHVVNLTRLGPHMVRVPLKFSHDDPPNTVKQALVTVAAAVPGVFATPPPDVITTGYADYTVEYEVTFTVKDYPAHWAVLNEFRTRVWYAARRHGLTMHFPVNQGGLQYEAIAGIAAQPAQTSLWDTLAAVSSLQTMPETDLRELADISALQHYARDEQVIREDDASATLYLVMNGEVLLSATDKHGVEREVLRLGEGEYVGILQVMLGQPSTVTARALTDLVLLAIPGEAANRMLDRSPQLARDLGQSLEARRQAILQAKEGRTAAIE
jgi:small-conductance mechanosensitive channel